MTHQHPTETHSGKTNVLELATVEEVQQSLGLWETEQSGLSSSNEADRVEMSVKGRLAGRIERLRILLRHDGLVLLGRVRTYHAKQLVQEAVLKLAETPIAKNAVEVV